ncbi:MAG: helix-turn-helix domain-containing protein [Caulobacterales bacterium]
MTPEEINLAIGKRLAERRRELGLSLAQVSKRCSVSLQQIHKYETGHTTLSVPMLVQLSRCLEAPLNYFIDVLEEPALERPVASRGTV